MSTDTFLEEDILLEMKKERENELKYSKNADSSQVSEIIKETSHDDRAFQLRVEIEEVEIEIKWDNIEQGTTDYFRNKTKDYILKIITKNPKILTSEIIDMIDYDEWEILEILDELKDEGKVK